MSFHRSYLSQFVNRGPSVDSNTILGNGTNYAVRLDQAAAPVGQSAWRVLGVHHLTPDENRSKHAVYVDIVDEQGNPLRDPNLRLAWGWDGQRADERVDPKNFDKGLGEPATNVDVYSGQHVWVRVEGDGLPSDTVSNLHTKHADEPDPSGEKWNTIGHHSFYVLFQRTGQGINSGTGAGTNNGAVTTPEPVPNPTPEPSPGTSTSEPTPTPPQPKKQPQLKVVQFGPLSHQDVINAFSRAASAIGLADEWALLTKAGMSIFELAQERRTHYQGPAIHELPNLTNHEKNAISDEMTYVLRAFPTPPVVEQPFVEQPTPPITPEPEPVTPQPAPPVPPAHGNKLGFYCHVSTDSDGLWNAIQRVQPPVIMIHADTANKMLLHEIRRFRAPDAFVIGRLYKDNHTQRMMLENDPDHHGRQMAEEILAYDFGLATQTGENGRKLIDAWMSLNEAVPGPGSGQFAEKPEETSRLLAAYDRFQVAFHQRLAESGVDAVAFNFGAGNFSRAAHYLDHFPQTLQSHTYLGFHEYGWPTMYPDPGSATSAATYKACMEGIRARFGDQHRVIITEAGLTRMYQNPQWGDKGWLNDDAPLSEDQYWESLNWYNGQMLQDEYVLGACLYEVGHHGDWRTFRHLGKDHQGNDIRIVDRIIALKDAALKDGQPRSAQSRSAQPRAAATPAPTAPATLTIKGQVTLNGFSVVDASVRLIGGDETLGATAGAALDAPSYVTWSRQISGVEGRLWDLWQRDVAQEVAGISWDEFKGQFANFNPNYDGKELESRQLYWLPENPSANDETRPVAVTWDRPLSGFGGSLWNGWIRYVQNKVVGLTYDQFKEAVVVNNPALAADETFYPDQIYSLPRNEGHKRYALQARSSARGHFSFGGLLPGSYELIVTAPNTEPYRTGFSIQESTELDIKLRPLALPAARAMSRSATNHDFVQVAGQDFVEQGKSFPFIGVNIRGLVHYGDTQTLKHSTEGHRMEMMREACNMGARVVRVFLPSRFADVDITIDRLHRVIGEISQNFPGLYLLPTFANLYGDVDFRIPGDEHFYAKVNPNWNTDLLNNSFFENGFEQNYLPFVRKVVSTFAHEPVIFAWGVGNELKLDPQFGVGNAEDPHVIAFINFMHRVANEIRALDSNHLITGGLHSMWHCWMHTDALKRRMYSNNIFDFVTVHCYNHQYEHDDSQLAVALNLPFIVEEAGFSTGFKGGDRVQLVRDDMDRWFNSGAKGYMPWGYMSTSNDMGDGDGDSGMDRSIHNDWDGLFNLFRERANHLAGQRRPMSVPQTKKLKLRPSKPVALEVGTTVYAHTVVNVRQSPGYLDKAEGDVLGQLAQGASATITGESQAKDDLIWWPINATLTDGQTVDAWAAQAVGGDILISTAQPLGTPRGLVTLPLG